MDKKLSFILPIYKVEKYLQQCVDSILSQSGDDCEIILVDDGSPDGCGAICDNYAQNHKNIKVIHKVNGGLGDARNAGLKAASGEYITFVDSDDYIAPGAVDKMLHWIQTQRADVCFLELTKVFPDGCKEGMGEALDRASICGREPADVLEFLATRPKFPGSACAKLLRRSLLEEKGFRFPDDRRLSEDLIFCVNVYEAAESFDYLDFPYYCYRQERSGSITNNVTAKYYFDTSLFVTEVVRRFSEDRKAKDRVGECMLAFAAYEYSILVWQLVFLKQEDRKQARAFLKNYKWILRYGRSSKTKLVKLAVAFLGLEGAAKLLDWYMTRR